MSDSLIFGSLVPPLRNWMICGSGSDISACIEGAVDVVVVSPPGWPVSCTKIVFLKDALGYSVSSEIAGYTGCGIIRLASHVSPNASSRPVPNSNTVNSLSVRLRSLSCSSGRSLV